MINPSTEEVICQVAEATEADVDIAVKAARQAFEGQWSETAPIERARLINKLADILERETKLLVALEALNAGKSITMAGVDVSLVIRTFRYYAGWADKITGQTIDVNKESLHFTLQEPVSTPCFKAQTLVTMLTCAVRLVSAVRSSLGTSHS